MTATVLTLFLMLSLMTTETSPRPFQTSRMRIYDINRPEWYMAFFRDLVGIIHFPLFNIPYENPPLFHVLPPLSPFTNHKKKQHRKNKNTQESNMRKQLWFVQFP